MLSAYCLNSIINKGAKMKISHYRHTLRFIYSDKNQFSYEFAQQILRAKNQSTSPFPSEKSKCDTKQKIIKKIKKHAGLIEKSYSANGGYFSYAQQIANRTRCGVIGVIGIHTSETKGKKRQLILFKPQGKIKAIFSKMGNHILSIKYISR